VEPETPGGNVARVALGKRSLVMSLRFFLGGSEVAAGGTTLIGTELGGGIACGGAGAGGGGCCTEFFLLRLGEMARDAVDAFGAFGGGASGLVSGLVRNLEERENLILPYPSLSI